MPPTTPLELHWVAASAGSAGGALHVYGGLPAALTGLHLGAEQARTLRLVGVEVVDLSAPVGAELE